MYLAINDGGCHDDLMPDSDGEGDVSCFKSFDLHDFLLFYGRYGGVNGVNLPFFIREFFGVDRSNPQYKCLEARVRRRLNKFVRLGFLETVKLGGLVWFKVSSGIPKRLMLEVKYASSKSWRKEAVHLEHVKGQLRVFESYLGKLEFMGIRVWSGFKDRDFIVKLDGKNKVKYALTGFAKLGVREIPVLVRVYGYNRTVTLKDVERDECLFEWFYDKHGYGLIIVISSSFFEVDAYKRLKKVLCKIGDYRIIVEGYNTRLPYLSFRRRLEIEQKYRLRYAKGYQVNSKRPKNPPKVVSLSFYESRVKMGYAKASKWIRFLIYHRLIRGDSRLRMYHILYGDLIHAWMCAKALGMNDEAESIVKVILKITKSILEYTGLDPPKKIKNVL